MATKAAIAIEAEDKFSATLARARAQFGGLEQSLNSVTSSAGLMSSRFVGLAAVAGAAAAMKSWIGTIDDLDEAAQGLGTTAVALSELQLAAKESGVGADQLGAALTKLNVKIIDAAGGGKEAVAAFKAIGVSVKDANGNVRGTEDVLRDVADRFSQYRDGAEKSALAVDLFGRAGAKLIAYLNQGGDALRKNSGLTEEAVQQAIKLQREFDTLSANVQRAANSIAGPLASALNSVFASFKQAPAEQLKGFNYQIEQLRNNMSRISPNSGAFADMSQKLTELEIKAANLRKELSKTGMDRYFENRAMARDKPAAPVPDKSDKPKVQKAAEIDDASRALGGFVEQLQRQRDALEEVTAQEQALQFLKENSRIDTPQVRELLLNQARIIDELKAEGEMRKELARIQKLQFDEEKRLTDQVLELAGVAEEERKIALTKQLEIMVEQGRLTQEQALQAVKGIAGIKDQIKDTDNFIGSLGDSMKDAFGDAVVGGEKLGDVLKRLNDRLLSMVTDNLFDKFLGSLFGGKGSGGAEGLFGAFAGIFGGLAGGGGAGGGANPAPEIGESFFPTMNATSLRPAASAGTTVVYNIAQVGSNVSRADMASAMEQTRAATIGQIQDLSARGRLKLA